MNLEKLKMMKLFLLTAFASQKMLAMLELLLAFHAWYKRGHPFSLMNEEEKWHAQSY